MGFSLSNKNKQNPNPPKQVIENMPECPIVHKEQANSQRYGNTSPSRLNESLNTKIFISISKPSIENGLTTWELKQKIGV